MIKSNLSDIKKALKETDNERLIEMLLKLAKAKKENKTFLDYWLFEEQDKSNYIQYVKTTIIEEFKGVNPNPFFAKKTLRRIIKIVKNSAKLLHDPEHEIDLWLFYCEHFNQIKFEKKTLPPVILNLYKNPVNRIHKLLQTVHEDLQFDFRKELEKLGDKG